MSNSNVTRQHTGFYKASMAIVTISMALLSHVAFASLCHDDLHTVCGPVGTCGSHDGQKTYCLQSVEWVQDKNDAQKGHWERCTYGGLAQQRARKCYIDTGKNNSCEPDVFDSQGNIDESNSLAWNGDPTGKTYNCKEQVLKAQEKQAQEVLQKVLPVIQKQ